MCFLSTKPTYQGVIFNLLEEIVRADGGDGRWDELLATAGASGAYTSLGSYPDGEFLAIVSAAADAAGESPDAVVRWFGRRALPLLARKYPELFAPHQSTRSFLLALNGIIHPEVRKIYADAEVPEFDYDSTTPGVLVMGYRSRRMQCTLGQGLVEGAAEHFGEGVTFEHLACMRRGDPSCRFRITFGPRGEAS